MSTADPLSPASRPTPHTALPSPSSLRRTSNLQGFAGDTTTPADQARAWKARFAPTVMFFGPDGRELAERLVGVAVPDFYGEYLQERLNEARRKLR
jgi:hypothetical protein